MICAIPHSIHLAGQPYPPLFTFGITDMQPLSRLTRTTNNLGVVDLPKSRRSSSEVAADKLKKRQTAEASAKKKQEQVARVARVEREIRVAQKEGALSSRPVSPLKKTFSRDASVDGQAREVSSFTSIAFR